MVKNRGRIADKGAELVVVVLILANTHRLPDIEGRSYGVGPRRLLPQGTAIPQPRLGNPLQVILGAVPADNLAVRVGEQQHHCGKIVVGV